MPGLLAAELIAVAMPESVSSPLLIVTAKLVPPTDSDSVPVPMAQCCRR